MHCAKLRMRSKLMKSPILTDNVRVTGSIGHNVKRTPTTKSCPFCYARVTASLSDSSRIETRGYNSFLVMSMLQHLYVMLKSILKIGMNVVVRWSHDVLVTYSV